ncbi:alpha/beta fold hydrolase [Pseudomonas palleroniana]|uniref:Alpha/beta hydrolase n=1 Tax=Pseudomonas palleroniana TaxID=191390 RepID=A0A1H5FIP2_9PSED|nr:alpha/beta hydrolase [Pseudomonas palleroniana]AVE08066.1 alpha/beta hydrolase [Pseudomonas palleroniana]KAB0563758.1 alpha/beta hydrolase [Pseudomonas palleroniana]PTC21966.1 alpha/beta hydrolase [Pseudomonas palleroniana]UOP09491.1 alpha/beta hydrolase [Pseudomonas palleroniana]SEE03257.1 haloacetate dehalogenase [Pseudomonas palleroniana]
MFAGFQKDQCHVNGVSISYRKGGSGPGLLLLHGHPQTHVIWHKVAEQLAAHFTVVAADLRGYGDSSKPPANALHTNYSKREMARDSVELMRALGFDAFSVLAHDRGARVAHRLALDHPRSVQRMVLLDIAPTLSMYAQTDEAFARAYWHWFFLIRPAPLPEALIESNPELYLRSVMGSRSAGLKPFTDAAFAEYLRCLSLPGSATGICEDYRASAGIDLAHDQADIDAGNQLNLPLLVLWGAEGTVGRCFEPLKEWQQVATDVRGKALPAGHYLAEEVPELLLDEVLTFLR